MMALITTVNRILFHVPSIEDFTKKIFIFYLQPFQQSDHIKGKGLDISGTITRKSNLLVVEYHLAWIETETSEIVIPQSEVPLRRNELWQETCFELFLAVKDVPNYWEFNFSPAGHWNAYVFSDYRHNMREERAFKSMPMAISFNDTSVSLSVTIDISQIVMEEKQLEAAISAVVRHADASLTYWALAHNGTRPDFHRRDGFLLTV